MAALNYHHLRYFRAIAREASLTRAAAVLNVAPSALSTQLRALEAQLGQPLFSREGRRLVLTEAGRIALDHAETIIRTGEELLDTLRGHRPAGRRALRVGAVTNLSRNFQLELLRPLIGRGDVELVVQSGGLEGLLALLEASALDVVLSNQPAPRDALSAWTSRLLDEQPLSLVGRPRSGAFRFPDDLQGLQLLLPGPGSAVRADFDLLLERAGVRPLVVAEVDDMAMLRLLARESRVGVALVPPVVVRDELRSGTLVEHAQVPGLREGFWAVTRGRRFPNPLLAEVLQPMATRGKLG